MPATLRTNCAAATHHPLATAVAREVLDSGGNSIDAAVAAMAALCVIVPGSVGIGGFGGTMILFLAESRRTICLDFDTRAPLEYRAELYATDAQQKSHFGALAVSTPMVVAGLAAALRSFGTKSWKDATAHAIALADEGVEVSAHHRASLEQWLAHADDLSRRAQFPDGAVPQVGQRWVQKDLARLLRTLADDGPDAFYRGEIADRIINQVRAQGGVLSLRDIDRCEPTLFEPLRINYRGHTILTPPSPGAGLTSLQILKVLEHFDLRAIEPWSARYLDLIARITRACWGDRDQLGDPDCVSIPYDDLLGDALAASRADAIRSNVPIAPSDVRPASPHTCNVCVADRAGNLVSLTATQGGQFGSCVVIDRLGLALGHGMARFEYNKPGHPNLAGAGKRPFHNMAPALILRDDKPFAAIGLPGGTRIPTVTAQLAVSLIDFGASPAQAVHAPRIHAEGGNTIVSEAASPQVLRELRDLGHQVQLGRHELAVPIMLGGPANAIRIDPAGHIDAASTADPDAAWVG